MTSVARLRLEDRPREQSDDKVDAWAHAHLAFLWRLSRRLGLYPADADDAVQQVFVIALQKADTIEPGKERSFLYGTTLRVVANARRARARRHELDAESLQLQASLDASPEAELERTRARELLDVLLERLPDELRRVLVLADIEGVTIPEIAELEQLPLGTATSRLRRARELFREQLQRAQARPRRDGSTP
ncbi:MAG TPA: sigma-70 family RNA polymerase sigma factor [Polyangiales bacterium]|nr:sigma-70 family RNA polymerase sigma factor [Polyangiales bacterium]